MKSNNTLNKYQLIAIVVLALLVFACNMAIARSPLALEHYSGYVYEIVEKASLMAAILAGDTLHKRWVNVKRFPVSGV